MLPSVGMFRQSVLESWALLRSLELADFRNPSPASDVRIVRAARATNTHRDEYDVYVNAAAYDFMLSDGAIMLFRRDSDNKTELSYQYYANPYDALSLHAFALEMG